VKLRAYDHKERAQRQFDVEGPRGEPAPLALFALPVPAARRWGSPVEMRRQGSDDGPLDGSYATNSGSGPRYQGGSSEFAILVVPDSDPSLGGGMEARKVRTWRRARVARCRPALRRRRQRECGWNWRRGGWGHESATDVGDGRAGAGQAEFVAAARAGG